MGSDIRGILDPTPSVTPIDAKDLLLFCYFHELKILRSPPDILWLICSNPLYLKCTYWLSST